MPRWNHLYNNLNMIAVLMESKRQCVTTYQKKI